MNRHRRINASLAALLVASPAWVASPVVALTDSVLPAPHVNASGKIYYPGNPNVLAPSATTDTTNPSNISGLFGAVTKLLSTLFSEQMTVRDYGASCLGNLDDALAANNMAINKGRLIVPQDCILRVATGATFSVPVTVAAGGSIKVDGVLLTLAGPVTAGPYQIFNPVNSGSVVFSNPQDRFAEWWGAKGSVSDNTSFINAAIAAGSGNVRLIASTYNYVGPLVDTKPKVHIIGVGDQATILLQNSATADGFDFGTPITTNAPTLPPASVQLYSSLEHVLLARNVVPSASLGTAPYNSAAKGVSIQAAGWVTLDDVHTYNSRIGIYRRHTNNTFTNRVISEIDYSIIGGDGLNFYVDSQDANYTSTGVGVQNANASTTDTDDAALCDNGQAGATAQSSSYYWRGNFSDYFGQKIQSAGCNGAFVDGSGADVNNGGSLTGGNAGTGNVSTNDFEVVDTIIDGFRDFGVRVANVPPNFSKVGFDGGYLLNGYTNAASAVDIESNGVSLTGSWAVDDWQNTNAANVCIYINNARETVIGNGVTLFGCPEPVYINNSFAFDVQPTIQSKDTRGSGQVAVNIVNSGYGRVAPAIDAYNVNGPVTGAWAAAVRVTGGTSSQSNELNLTRVAPYAIVGGFANVQCDDNSTGTPNGNYTSATAGAPYFGQRLCTGKNLVTGTVP